MHRTDGDGNVAGLFVPGDPVMGQVATEVKADWLNDVQEEICNVVTGAGIALVKGTRTQLRSAIQAIITSRLESLWTSLPAATGSAWTAGVTDAWREATGTVRLSGSREIPGPSVTSGQVASPVVELPASYRPSVTVNTIAWLREHGSGTGPYVERAVRVQVTAAGVVSVLDAASLTHSFKATLYLDNVSFVGAGL